MFCSCDGSAPALRCGRSLLISQLLTNICVSAGGHTGDPVSNEEREEEEGTRRGGGHESGCSVRRKEEEVNAPEKRNALLN